MGEYGSSAFGGVLGAWKREAEDPNGCCSLALKLAGESRQTGLEVLLSDSKLAASSAGFSRPVFSTDWLDESSDLRCGLAADGTRMPPVPEGLGTKVKLTGGREGVRDVRCFTGVSGG